MRIINDDDLTDLVKAILAPIQPYGSVFSFSRGTQKSIRGNYQLFEMDQNRLRGVINHLNKAGIGEQIYCVLCGRMTPVQKQIVHRRSKVNTQLCIDILTWFIQQSGHPGYKNTAIPDNCHQPLLVKDCESTNNTDESVDINVESNYESGTYSFSTAQDPSVNASVYGSSDNLLLQCCSALHKTYWYMMVHMPTMFR